MKLPKKCIFCGTQGNISKEHFWPEWLAPYISEANASRHISVLQGAEGKDPQQLHRHSERDGSVLTKKIRAVCENCNNGWMSQLESAAKPTLIALINRSNLTLSSKDAQTLALWVSVKTIVGEYTNENTALTIFNDRQLLGTLNTIPKYFRIFIGYHSLETQAAYLRHSTTVSTDVAGPNPPLPNSITRNIQTTCFLVGPLIFYAIAARVQGFNIATLNPSIKMIQLWPQTLTSLDLNAITSIDANEVSIITNRLTQLIAQPQVKYGGRLPNQN